ncbi:hypothetical protein ACSSS7_007112 [Eimeria intestinalis]
MEAFGIGEETPPPFSSRTSPGNGAFRAPRSFSSQLSGPLTTALTQQLSFADSSAAPGDLGRQLTRQLTQMMNRGADAEYTDESPRGEEHSPLVYYLGARLLRSGLITQAFALALQILIFLVFGGKGWFNANPFAAPDVLKGAAVYVHLSAFLEVAFLIGVIQVAAFQVLIADNSKFTLGFRSGSKLLACAVSLDLAAAALRVAASLHFCRFVSARWLGRNMQLSGEWCLSYLGATLQGLALLSYGLAFAALELYHDKGVGDNHAWAMLVLYPLAGIAKLSSIYLSLTSLSPLLLLASLLAAYRWAQAFEPLLERWSPELHARRLDDSILPNPRTVAFGGEEGAPQAGERYTYAAIPAAAAQGDSAAAAGAAAAGLGAAASFPVLGSRNSFARAGISFERGASAASSGLPTTYDYQVLQQQVREHEQAQTQQQQQQQQLQQQLQQQQRQLQQHMQQQQQLQQEQQHNFAAAAAAAAAAVLTAVSSEGEGRSSSKESSSKEASRLQAKLRGTAAHTAGLLQQPNKDRGKRDAAAAATAAAAAASGCRCLLP